MYNSRKGKRWTQKEDEILISKYGIVQNKELEEELNRTISSIHQRAYVLKITNAYPDWKREEVFELLAMKSPKGHSTRSYKACRKKKIRLKENAYSFLSNQIFDCKCSSLGIYTLSLYCEKSFAIYMCNVCGRTIEKKIRIFRRDINK